MMMMIMMMMNKAEITETITKNS